MKGMVFAFGSSTYAVETREGGIGILQITGFTDKPKAVKIRYKMVQKTDVQLEIADGSKEKLGEISKRAKTDLHEKMVQMDARQFAEAYLGALKVQDWNLAASMCRPGSKQARNAPMLGEMCDFGTAAIDVVYANNTIALATTSGLKEIDGRDWQLGFTLRKEQHIWILKDMDWLPPDKVQSFVDKFLESFPDAKLILANKTGQDADDGAQVKRQPGW